MAGPLALVGSGEFLPSTDDVDHSLVTFDAAHPPRVAIVPTAAGQEGAKSIERWLALGVDHYERLGGRPVSVPATDTHSANDPDLAALVDGADLIYFSGGDPLYVTETMRGSLVWAAVLRAWQNGAALAGCSAGAMMMGSVTASPRSSGLRDGLGLFRRLCVIPHFDRIDRFRPGMADSLVTSAPAGTVIVGVDEHTGLVHDGAAWSVRGQQSVWVFEEGERTQYQTGEAVPLDVRFGA
jgi:cyanophycinase